MHRNFSEKFPKVPKEKFLKPYSFCPFAIEATGTWGGKARYLTQLLIQKYDLRQQCSKKEAGNVCRTVLQLSILRSLCRQLERAYPCSFDFDEAHNSSDCFVLNALKLALRLILGNNGLSVPAPSLRQRSTSTDSKWQCFSNGLGCAPLFPNLPLPAFSSNTSSHYRAKSIKYICNNSEEYKVSKTSVSFGNLCFGGKAKHKK